MSTAAGSKRKGSPKPIYNPRGHLLSHRTAASQKHMWPTPSMYTSVRLSVSISAPSGQPPCHYVTQIAARLRFSTSTCDKPEAPSMQDCHAPKPSACSAAWFSAPPTAAAGCCWAPSSSASATAGTGPCAAAGPSANTSASAGAR